MMEYITPLIDLFKQLFTIEQQRSLFFITLSVFLGLEIFKGIVFSFWQTKKKLLKRGIIWTVALSIGALGGWVNVLITKTDQPLWFWLVVGGLCGGAAIVLYKLVLFLIKWKFKK